MKVLLSTIIVTICLIAPTIQAQELQGSWKGELEVMGQKLPLIFHFQQPGEAWEGKMDSPNQGARGLKFTKVLFDGLMLHAEMEAGAIIYEGVFMDGMIKGTFKQGGMSFPLDLMRTALDAETSSPKRPQIPREPFEYDVVETSFKNQKDDIVLYGTLTKPLGNGPFPAVILVSGSGPQDRDSNILGHPQFLVLSDYLTRKGIAVLRYDERGVGKSEGDFSKASTIDFRNDAQKAIEHLRIHPFVDQTKVGVIGHSEGGIIAWMLGAEMPALNFLIALAAPVVPIPELMAKQTEAVSRSSGLSEEMTARQVALNTRFYDLVKNSQNVAEAKAGLDPIIAESLDKQLFPEAQKEQQKAALIKAYEASLTSWFMDFIKTVPETYIRKIEVPVFAAFGGKDVQVDAVQNGNRLQELLEERNDLLDIRVYPNLNHLLQTAETGAVAEYSQLEETFNETVMADIVAFILSL